MESQWTQNIFDAILFKALKLASKQNDHLPGLLQTRQMWLEIHTQYKHPKTHSCQHLK